MSVSRRQFLGAALAAPLVSAGCGFLPARGGDADALTFTTWGTDAELAGFRKAIASFEQASPGSSVQLNAVPYDQMFTNLDAQFQAGNEPDLFRVPYYTLGSYAGRGQLLDLTQHVPAAFGDRFTPTAWAAVHSRGNPVGVPHHTDTSVILYNIKLLRSAGITAVPSKVEDAWTWQQFEQVGQRLRAALPSTKYPFALNWQGNGVTRWLSWLFQQNGRFLNTALTKPAIDSAAGRQALEFTKGFFGAKLVPPNDSVKSTSLAADMWFSQTAVMAFSGAFQLPDAQSTATFDWGATFAPRGRRGGGDFGGNALVATARTTRVKQAVAFLEHLTQREQMLDFCTRASLLPTRHDLASTRLEFAARADLSPVFTGQAKLVRPGDANQVASPSMLEIITVLQDQLERAFVGGQGTDATLTGLSAGIAKALAA